MLEVVGHWIDGAPTAGVGDRAGAVRDPVTGATTAEVACAVSSDVDAAVAAARVAFRSWSAASHAERAEVLGGFRERLGRRKGEIASAIAAEHGKSLGDALGEVARGLEAVDVACSIPAGLAGVTSARVGAVALLRGRRPRGVVAIVTDTEYPALAPLWLFACAIAAGNAVVVMPGRAAPSVAQLFAQTWADCGLPPGVFNVLHGDGAAADTLVRHRGVDVVSVMGPTALAERLHATATSLGKRAHALGRVGGHAVVLADADLDLATSAVLGAGLGPAGEAVMTTSVAVVVDAVAEDFNDRVRRRLRGQRAAGERGSLVARAHRCDVDRYIDRAVSEGARLTVDGRLPVDDESRIGFWLGPTVLDRVTTVMDAYAADVYGPVLRIVRAATTDCAVAVVRANRHLTAVSVFSRHLGAAGPRIADGATSVVSNVPVALAGQYRSWGDWALSLFGDPRPQAARGAEFFTSVDDSSPPRAAQVPRPRRTDVR
jgi:malonate-semialdehyde dehydrogenase (acetylating)/methylmalonate-semialdehyde dehydrogenase